MLPRILKSVFILNPFFLVILKRNKCPALCLAPCPAPHCLSDNISAFHLCPGVKHNPSRSAAESSIFSVFKGRKSEAEKFFLKAIELDPTKGNCYMHYGEW